MRDSKFICDNQEIRGTVISTDNLGETRHKPDFWCSLKNINLNNIACGICATFRAKNKKTPNEELKNIVSAFETN